MDQHRKSLTMGRSVGTQQQNEKLKSARSIGELSAIVETGRPSSANPTDNSAGKGNQLQVPGIKETPIKSAPSFAILDASSGEEDSLVAEQHDTQRKSIDGSNNSEKATNNRRLSSYYVTTSSGGIQPTAQFLESSEDQRFLARHFPDICTEPIQGSIGCALEREVLWHGRLVYTAKHLCFRGRLFAKAIKILVPFRDILAIEKKSTVLIPNGLRVVTLHSKVHCIAIITIIIRIL
jgi:hypothetical protein